MASRLLSELIEARRNEMRARKEHDFDAAQYWAWKARSIEDQIQEEDARIRRSAMREPKVRSYAQVIRVVSVQPDLDPNRILVEGITETSCYFYAEFPGGSRCSMIACGVRLVISLPRSTYGNLGKGDHLDGEYIAYLKMIDGD